MLKIIRRANLLFNTLRYLKWIQIYRRLIFRIIPPRMSAMTAMVEFRSPMINHWKIPSERLPSLVGINHFRFLNYAHTLPAEGGWDQQELSKLWRYNLHYFDDLNATQASERREMHQLLIDRWIRENPAPSGTAWEPYPTSLRIVNWIKWNLAGNSLSTEALQSLFRQARWLSKRIEWHLLGNHLFINSKALVFSGLFFKGSESAIWLRTGLKIIKSQLACQVLPDGGHFERSPMYHALFIEDLLDLINLAQCYPDLTESEQLDEWRAIASRMLEWLGHMTHPDGGPAFFNDTAGSIAPTLRELKNYASRLGILDGSPIVSSTSVSLIHLPDTGYIQLKDRFANIFLDVAPIGPDYLPGHAHADTLSFEMSLFGERVFVNSGISQYGDGPTRLKERGTAAHNTVLINGQNSSEVWSGFRVAKRAYPLGLKVVSDHDMAVVHCGHDGYTRLPGRPMHIRIWTLQTGRLLIEDQIKGLFESATAFLHLAPNIHINQIDANNFQFSLQESKQIVSLSIKGANVALEPGYYAPEFGILLNNYHLLIHFDKSSSVSFDISWGK